MKLFICGYGRHGKDTAANFLKARFGMNFVSSSMFMAERVVMPYLLEEHDMDYDSAEECFEDRHNHREKWHIAIADYNKEDLTRLSREIFEQYDIYVGIRSCAEFLASRELADLSIWIKDPRKPDEGRESCSIIEQDCDFTVLNSGSIDYLHRKLNKIFSRAFLGLEVSQHTVYKKR